MSTLAPVHRQTSLLENANPARLLMRVWASRVLIGQLTKREIELRYRGSLLGALWAFLTPLIMLAVFTFVFVGVLNFRFDRPGVSDHIAYQALILYCGLTVYYLFSEAVGAAPQLISQNPNYVKKVVFPTEWLAVSVLLSTVFRSLMNLVAIVLVLILIEGSVPWTIILLPIVYLPLLALTLGLSWILCAMGTFLGDISSITMIMLQAALFLTPIFYPTPESYELLYAFNPLSTIVENFRMVALWGEVPGARGWLIVTGMSLLVMMIGYVWFMKSKRSFADVV